MKNKKIILGIVLLLLLELPNIACAWYTDNFSTSILNKIWFLIDIFIVTGLPLLGIALFFTSIYLIVKKIRDNKKMPDNSSGLNNNLKSKNKVIIVIFTSIFLILSIVFIFIGFNIYSKVKYYAERDKAIKNKYGTWTYDCVQHSYSDYIGSFFQEYTVKKGDTLLSISKEKLQDPVKVTDIITLNREKYPSLSYNNQLQILEPGWKLILPPPGLNTIGSSFAVSNGKLLEKTSDGNGIYWVVGNKKNSYDYYHSYKSTIIDDGIRIGDCIDIIGQSDVFKINKQN